MRQLALVLGLLLRRFPKRRGGAGEAEIRRTVVAKLTKRVVDAADVREKDYFIWDDELPGFGLRVFASGRRSYLIQYRAAGSVR